MCWGLVPQEEPNTVNVNNNAKKLNLHLSGHQK